MNSICLHELSDLDRYALLAALIAAAILILLGLGMSFHLKFVQVLATLIHEKITATIPAPYVMWLAGFAVLGGIYWWLNNQYSANDFLFKDKAWTLAEIQSRLEETSGVDIKLKGDAASFAIDKNRPVGGACASDALQSLCDIYRDQINCSSEPGRTVIERKP